MAGIKELGLTVYPGNEVTLLPSGREKFIDLDQQIRDARHFINVEYFKFRTDSIGRAFFSLLAQKVREGVQVRVLYDRLGTKTTNDSSLDPFLDSLRAMDMKIYGFDPVRFPWVNHFAHRDHRKIVVIDGHTAYTGGMNVCDYYIHGTPKVGRWHDMHVRINGPAVHQFQHIFSVMWYHVSGEILELDPTFRCTQDTWGNVPIAVADRQPHFQSRIMRDAYVLAINNADSLIQIVNPYPTNLSDVRKALYRALKRGVRVEFMVSSNCDNNVTPDVVGIEMKHMMNRGAHVYYLEGGFHHGKVMIVDGAYCTVGSTNLDGRSLAFDFETNAFIFDPLVAQRFQHVFQDDRDNRCSLLTPRIWRQRYNFGHRVLGRMASFAKYFL